MNRLKTPSIVLILILGTSAAIGEPAKRMKMRDAATHNELSQKLRMTLQNDPIRKLGPEVGNIEEDPAVRTHSRDLVRDSTVITYRGNLTLVPKRAVLFIPDHLKTRIGVKSGMKVMTWHEFFQINRGWIRTVEVTRDQVMGNAPLPSAIVEAFAKSSSMVVATFKGGPVSVLPMKKSEDTETETASEPLTQTTVR